MHKVLLKAVDIAKEHPNPQRISVHAYRDLVAQLTRLTLEPRNNYRWPLPADHPIIQLIEEDKFSLTMMEYRGFAQQNILANHYLPHYLKWLKRPKSKVNEPLMAPWHYQEDKDPTKLTKADLKPTKPEVHTHPTQTSMPHWKTMVVLPNLAAYREAYAGLKPNFLEEQYMQLKEDKKLTAAELKFQGGRYDFRTK